MTERLMRVVDRLYCALMGHVYLSAPRGASHLTCASCGRRRRL